MGTEAYVGATTLESMQCAKNYNYAIEKLLSASLKGAVVLDFGAGAGEFSERMLTNGFNVIAVEPDPTLAAKLQRSGIHTELHLDSLAGQLFDSIMTINVLEHIEQDAVALEELFTLIRPGGAIVIFVPAHPILYSTFDRNIGHWRRYSRGDLISKVSSAGFELKRVGNFDPLGGLLALVYRLLGPRNGSLNARFLKLFDLAVFPMSLMIGRVFPGIPGKNYFVVAEKPL